MFVLNPKVEFERRKSVPGEEEKVLEEEIAFDIAAGVSYRFAPKWFIGLEYRHQSDYLSPVKDGAYEDPKLKPSSFDLSDFKIGSQHQGGNYIGPTVHYAEKHWWATVGVLYQFNGHGRAGGDANSDGRNWDEHEEYHIGLIYGYEF